jgi:hypothetical protein
MHAIARPLLHGASRFALACACLLLGFVALDIGYRIHAHRPVLALDDLRTARLQYLLFGDRGAFDPALGWAPREEYRSDGYSTLGFGIRRNAGESEIRTGGILVVGDAFAGGGPEVEDAATWPAQLEKAAGTPVINAGVSGYATDQTVLRAERLLAAVRPKTLVVEMSDEGIAQAGLSSYGRSKPYFTLEDGRLAYHPPASVIADENSLSGWGAAARSLLAHSAILDVVLSRLASRYWFGTSIEAVTRRAGNDPVAVTCALIERLKSRADQDAVRVLVFMQHTQRTVAETAEPGADTKRVAACAGAAGIQVVDQFQELRAVAAAGPGVLADLYVQGYSLGELSAEGNRRAAELLARVLAR